MKISRWSVILLCGLTAFVIATILIIVLRQRSIQLQPSREAKSYPHTHLQSSEWEPKSKISGSEYKLGNGETLASVARARYGHQKYSSVIKLYNHIQDETAVKAGTALRVPDMAIILHEEGVTNVAPGEVELILCARAKYDKVVDELWRLRTQSGGTYALPEHIQQELLQAANDLQQATEGLEKVQPGVNNAPSRTIGQLEQSMGGMRNLAWGDHSDPNGYDIDMVQQRYALALTYAIIWAREGFK
jgi:hypothetical protein